MDILPTIKNDAIVSEVRNQKMMRTYQKRQRNNLEGVPTGQILKNLTIKIIIIMGYHLLNNTETH